MNEKQRKKHIREPPSIPFIWETKPGIPIKDWKPVDTSFCQLPKTPLKQIASVPFVWEEKPGIPLPTAISSSPASSESDSSISSYETGRSSLTGSAFLECLFPLFPPKSGFLERDIGYTEKVGSSLVELNDNDFELGDYYTFDLSNKQPTLGELIMMSRRRSCRRKATQMNKWDPPKKTARKKVFGCFSTLTSSSMIEGMLKRKYYPRLKLL
ncbi:uncharacterized protein LOC123897042 [Trifolium pratense]|uniref:uncharacterized protein LOC123897042 n=1 Tax=Trifolium pratense TaxID=57577 RepID=UPI001E6914A7|nr:uncharacterized protein LOC123897042 [Trifolium pratense]